MITVAGKALIDLVVDHDGRVRARPGGGPFNTARTIGRLGRAPAFLGRLSQDSFGHLLWASLDQDSVTLAGAATGRRPHHPRRRGCRRGRSAPLPLLSGRHKLSVEDLAYLYPDATARTAASALLDQGPELILITDGPRPARALLQGQEVSVDVPAVQVVDTIGAGNAFGGALLAWWSRNELTRSDLHRSGPVREALQAAAEVASLTCTRAGAEPPWFAEVTGKPGWRSGPGTKRRQPLP
jgi:sugar/nucleoside kinase (ribokinase family)